MKSKALLILVLVVASGVAQAGTLTQMFSAPFNKNISDADFDILLPQFNPALGKLCEVILDLNTTTSGSTISWDNEAPVSSSIDLGVGVEVTATGPSGLEVVAVPLQIGNSTVDADNEGAADFLGSDAFSVTGGSGSDTDSNSLTGPANDLLPYKGVGNITIEISNDDEVFLSTSGGYGPISPTQGIFNGTIQVTYKYTKVPEPTASVIAILGCCGILLTKRR